MAVIKKLVIFVLLLFFIYVTAIAATLNMYRFKVTDPKNPEFKAEDFRYADYFYNDDVTLAEAKLGAFPLGSPKSFVDKVLIDGNGARVTNISSYLDTCPQPESKSRYLYVIDPWWELPVSLMYLNLGGYSHGIAACFDANNNLTQI